MGLEQTGPNAQGLLGIAPTPYNDWTGALLTVSGGGTAPLLNTGALWGTSAVGGSSWLNVPDVGLVAKQSATTWVLTVPAVGAVATAAIVGVTDGYPFDVAAGPPPAYAALQPLTRAKLDAAVAGAGFGGRYHDPVSGSTLAST